MQKKTVQCLLFCQLCESNLFLSSNIAAFQIVRAHIFI
uniref:Uncharacterized protein n=1 Tax=Arundo donax TaxID=35708 RepID=A0A0A9C5E9_ARUDO